MKVIITFFYYYCYCMTVTQVSSKTKIWPSRGISNLSNFANVTLTSVSKFEITEPNEHSLLVLTEVILLLPDLFAWKIHQSHATPSFLWALHCVNITQYNTVLLILKLWPFSLFLKALFIFGIIFSVQSVLLMSWFIHKQSTFFQLNKYALLSTFTCLCLLYIFIAFDPPILLFWIPSLRSNKKGTTAQLLLHRSTTNEHVD